MIDPSRYHLIVTHPGSAHKDELLACCVLLASNSAPIERREPTGADLDDPATAVVDVGDEHDPRRGNFDHHQFPREHPPLCSLSLVLQDLGLYEDAKQFCEWLEPAEWFDCRGANRTAEWLGVERDIIGKLNSPIDVTLLRRFAVQARHEPGETIWEMMRLIGLDLIEYLTSLRQRLDYIHQHRELWALSDAEGKPARFLFLPRLEPLADEPSAGLALYLKEQGLEESVIGMVYPDRRSGGYGLTRYNDHPSLDFCRIEAEPDVHFAHKSGFLAKTSATDQARLKQLATQALVSPGLPAANAGA